MLKFNEILTLTEEMGIEIRNSSDGKHYILNNLGDEIEFNVRMLGEFNEDRVVFSEGKQVNIHYVIDKFAANTNSNSYGSVYLYNDMINNESIINAA